MRRAPPADRAIASTERVHWMWWALALYATLALVSFVLPLGSRFGSGLLGSVEFPHDSFGNAAVLEWGYRALWSPSHHVFNWVAGYPLENSLATGEHLLGWQLFYTPLRALGVGTIAAYNVLMIGAFLLSALGAAALARRFGASTEGACLAGLAFGFTGFHLTHALHLQTMGVAWSPLAFHGLDVFLVDGRRRGLVGALAAFLITMYSAIYFGVFLSVLMPAYTVLAVATGRGRLSRANLAWAVAAGAVAAAAVLPVALIYSRFAAVSSFKHPVDDSARFSIELLSVLRAPQWQVLWGRTPMAQSDHQSEAFPGLVALLAAGYFLLRRPASGEWRRLRVVLGVLTVLCFLFALGPVLKLRGNWPARCCTALPMPGRLLTLLPGIRWPMRILLYSYLFGGVMAGLGLTAFLSRMPAKRRVLRGAGAVGLAALEYFPAPWYASQSADAKPPLAMSAAYPLLAREADRGAVAELPAADSTGYRTPMMVRYVYGSSGHLRRVLGFWGNSSRPPVLDSLQTAANSLPDESARRLLVSHGVTRLVVHRPYFRADSAPKLVSALVASGYPVLLDSADAALFALTGPAAPTMASAPR